jgi:hypothetical protein
MICLITPTGARPNQFSLCANWMKNQTYTGDVIWLIVDDAYPRSTDRVNEGFKDKWTIVKIYPTPVWSGQNTQTRNIKAGIDTLLSSFDRKDIEAIFIIEDDDYYRPAYLERMMHLKGNYDIWGEVNTIYYNVFYRKYAANNNNAHVSLFQTAITVEGISGLESSYNQKFIDCVLWTKIRNKYLFFDNFLAVGMKGMPGRGGIGAGHSKMFSMLPDPGMLYLKNLIGETDASLYERFYNGVGLQSHDILTHRRR